MELVAYTDADMAVREVIECDPETLRELGGPIAREEVLAPHRRWLEGIANDEQRKGSPSWGARTVGDVAAPEPGGEVVATE